VNYYRVADLLGSQHAPVDTTLFPHSWFSFRIRADFREKEVLRGLLYSRLGMVSGFMGNSRADIHKASDIFADLFRKLIDSIPYLSEGAQASGVEQERMHLIEAYNKMVADRKAREEKRDG